jgi:hypothetical protein
MTRVAGEHANCCSRRLCAHAGSAAACKLPAADVDVSCSVSAQTYNSKHIICRRMEDVDMGGDDLGDVEDPFAEVSSWRGCTALSSPRADATERSVSPAAVLPDPAMHSWVTGLAAKVTAGIVAMLAIR